MNKEQVLEILKSINYPGFSRDIVSFGMISSLEIEDRSITVELKITSQNEEKKRAVGLSIESALKKTGEFNQVEITHVQPQSAPVKTGQTQGVEPASPLAGIKYIIAVASGKGGVGKSTVAANIALALKQKDYSVGLLDLDIYGPSLPIILGINSQPELTSQKKLKPIEQYGLKVMSFGFISGNETPVIWRGPMVSRMTEQFFRDVEWGKLDYLILDLPPGTGDIQLTLTQKLKLDGAIMVTTPQDIALADVRKGADMFRKVQAPVIGVIENMSGFQIEGKIDGDIKSLKLTVMDKEIPLDKFGKFNFKMDLFKRGGGKNESKRLNVPLLAEIPFDRAIMETTDMGEPMVIKYPQSPITEIYGNIAARIVDILEN
ncbi:MAG: Mrp/NBP35 family ATP-binding protein [Candidatus Neomarinimicrobiota bacterium]